MKQSISYKKYAYSGWSKRRRIASKPKKSEKIKEKKKYENKSELEKNCTCLFRRARYFCYDTMAKGKLSRM